MYNFISDCTYKGCYTIFLLLCLTYFTQYEISKKKLEEAKQAFEDFDLIGKKIAVNGTVRAFNLIKLLKAIDFEAVNGKTALETYIYLPDGETNYEDYLYTRTWGHSYGENCICENCGETCPHPDAVYEEVEYVEETCFEPGMNGYWFCEECYQYLDENKENGF